MNKKLNQNTIITNNVICYLHLLLPLRQERHQFFVCLSFSKSLKLKNNNLELKYIYIYVYRYIYVFFFK